MGMATSPKWTWSKDGSLAEESHGSIPVWVEYPQPKRHFESGGERKMLRRAEEKQQAIPVFTLLSSVLPLSSAYLHLSSLKAGMADTLNYKPAHVRWVGPICFSLRHLRFRLSTQARPQGTAISHKEHKVHKAKTVGCRPFFVPFVFFVAELVPVGYMSTSWGWARRSKSL
jgi:hypothetical protein